MTDKVIVYTDKAGHWRWRRVAPNNEPVAASEGYTRKADAIEAAERQAGDDAVVVVSD